MSHKPTVILFGRFPQYGVGKRRLAAGIGNLKTWQFYRQNLAETKRRLKDPRWNLKFCATPDKFSNSHILKQGQGDLGERLIRIIRQHKGLVIVVGTDVPDICPQHIVTVLADLKKGGAVLGRGKPPLDDGGFWCLGLRVSNQVCVSPHLLSHVRWSHETTADITKQRLSRAGFKVIETLRHNDIDDKIGYDLWRSSS